MTIVTKRSRETKSNRDTDRDSSPSEEEEYDEGGQEMYSTKPATRSHKHKAGNKRNDDSYKEEEPEMHEEEEEARDENEENQESESGDGLDGEDRELDDALDEITRNVF